MCPRVQKYKKLTWLEIIVDHANVLFQFIEWSNGEI